MLSTKEYIETPADHAEALARLNGLDAHIRVNPDQEVFDAWKESKYGAINVWANTAPVVERALLPAKERYRLQRREIDIAREAAEAEELERLKVEMWEAGLSGTD